MQCCHLRSWPRRARCAPSLLVAAPASAQSTPRDRRWRHPIRPRCARSKPRLRRSAASSRCAEPDLQLLDHASLHAYLADQFERDYLPSERESDQKELVAARPDQADRRPGPDPVGSAERPGRRRLRPRCEVLFVRRPIRRAFGPAERMTYAHEFNHALQDQHFDLNKIAPKHPDSNDRSLAVHAVIEGDAIMLQTLWAQAQPHAGRPDPAGSRRRPARTTAWRACR